MEVRFSTAEDETMKPNRRHDCACSHRRAHRYQDPRTSVADPDDITIDIIPQSELLQSLAPASVAKAGTKVAEHINRTQWQATRNPRRDRTRKTATLVIPEVKQTQESSPCDVSSGLLEFPFSDDQSLTLDEPSVTSRMSHEDHVVHREPSVANLSKIEIEAKERAEKRMLRRSRSQDTIPLSSEPQQSQGSRSSDGASGGTELPFSGDKVEEEQWRRREGEWRARARSTTTRFRPTSKQFSRTFSPSWSGPHCSQYSWKIWIGGALGTKSAVQHAGKTADRSGWGHHLCPLSWYIQGLEEVVFAMKLTEQLQSDEQLECPTSVFRKTGTFLNKLLLIA